MQSPWIIDGQRKGESSVEERIADAVLPHFKADKHKFMSAGQCTTTPVLMLIMSEVRAGPTLSFQLSPFQTMQQKQPCHEHQHCASPSEQGLQSDCALLLETTIQLECTLLGVTHSRYVLCSLPVASAWHAKQLEGLASCMEHVLPRLLGSTAQHSLALVLLQPVSALHQCPSVVQAGRTLMYAC